MHAACFSHSCASQLSRIARDTQIGLTALAYEKCYPLLKPSMKIDHWIGCMYAIMNTCQELQRAGIDPGKLESACVEGDAAVSALQEAYVPACFVCATCKLECLTRGTHTQRHQGGGRGREEARRGD